MFMSEWSIRREVHQFLAQQKINFTWKTALEWGLDALLRQNISYYINWNEYNYAP